MSLGTDRCQGHLASPTARQGRTVVTLSINIDLLQLGLQFGWNGVHFCRWLPFNETSPATAQILAEASDESRPLRGKVLHKGILKEKTRPLAKSRQGSRRLNLFLWSRTSTCSEGAKKSINESTNLQKRCKQAAKGFCEPGRRVTLLETIKKGITHGIVVGYRTGFFTVEDKPRFL
mgnify:FL=1